MQPSEEFRPLPHIYLSARRGAERSGAARRQRDLGRARSAGPPFIVRQPRGLARARGEGVQIKERRSEGTERNRGKEREGNGDEPRIRTRPVPGHYYDLSV